jgi:glutathione S-transferase
MIKLYSFGTSFGVMDPSPFVVKVDTFLRMSGLSYKALPNFNNIKKSPKGKLPFIEDDGNKIADSSFIIDYLTQKYDLSLDAFLTVEQKALSHLITKSIDENLYWCLVYSRWIADDTWPLINKAFFGNLPWPLKLFLPALIRKSVKKTYMVKALDATLSRKF